MSWWQATQASLPAYLGAGAAFALVDADGAAGVGAAGVAGADGSAEAQQVTTSPKNATGPSRYGNFNSVRALLMCALPALSVVTNGSISVPGSCRNGSGHGGGRLLRASLLRGQVTSRILRPGVAGNRER